MIAPARSMPAELRTASRAAAWRPWLCGGAILLITFAVFARLIGCGFTWWDDPDTIFHNPLLNPPTWAGLGHYWRSAGAAAPAGLYIPLTYTLWMALAIVAGRPPDAEGIGLDPRVFHAGNVLLHALAAVGVFWLLRRLLRRDWPAAAGALLFALHPVQVEAVAWASGTKDVLCGLLSIAALTQYVAAVDGGRAQSEQSPAALPRAPRPPNVVHWIIATLLLVAAILSKPTAVMVPAMAMAIDRLLLRRPWRAIAGTLWPWAIVAIAGAAVARWSQSAPWSSPLPVWDRPAVAADALAFYLGKLLWPIRLCPDYGHRPALVLANGWLYFTWITPAAIAAALVLLRRRWPIGVAAGWLMLLPLAPVLGFVGFDFQFFSTTADHYLYLAMLGPALAAAGAVRAWPRAGTVAAAAILAALAGRTLLQEPLWQNTQTLFEHTLAINPQSFTAADMLGFVHVSAGERLGVSAGQLRRADPALAEAVAEASRRQLREAVRHFRRAIAIDPQYVPAWVGLANADRALGDPAAAREDMHRVLVLQPITPPAFRADPLGLAERLVAFGDSTEALPLLDQILARNPSNAEAQRWKKSAIAAMRARHSHAAPDTQPLQ